MSAERGIFCEVCGTRFPGESEADVFKHNLTWEHRSKMEASQLSGKGCGSSGKQQQQKGARGKFEGTSAMADITTAGVIPVLLRGVSSAEGPTQSTGTPKLAFQPPPSQPGNHPPLSRFFPPSTTPPPLFPLGPYPLGIPPPLFPGWPPPPAPLLPPKTTPYFNRAGPPITMSSRLTPPPTTTSSVSFKASFSAAPSPVTPSPLTTSSVQLPSQTRPVAITVPAAAPPISTSGSPLSHSQPTPLGTLPPYNQPPLASQTSVLQPSKGALPTPKGTPISPPLLPLPFPPIPSPSQPKVSPPLPPPIPSTSQPKVPPPPPPFPVGKIRHVLVSIPSPVVSSSSVAGVELSSKGSGKTGGSEAASSSSTRLPTDPLFGRKPPSMRIPKITDTAKKLQSAKNSDRKKSPSISWDDALVSPNGGDEKMPLPVTCCSSVGTTLNSTGPATQTQKATSANYTLTWSQSQRANSSTECSPKRKKKKKKKKGHDSASGASNAPETFNSGAKKAKWPKNKKLKQLQKAAAAFRQARENPRGTVVRDTSPKFVPPEKPKRSRKLQPTVDGSLPMKTWPNSGSSSIERHPPNTPPARRPTSVNGAQPVAVSQARPSGSALIPHHPEVKRLASLLAREIGPRGRPFVIKPARTHAIPPPPPPPVSVQPPVAAEPMEVAQRRSSGSAPTEQRPTNPALDKKPWMQTDSSEEGDIPMDICKTEPSVIEEHPPSLGPSARMAQRPGSLLATGNEQKYRPCGIANVISTPPVSSKHVQQSVGQAPRETSSSEQPTAGSSSHTGSWLPRQQSEQLLLPPSGVKGESLLFGDVILIESQGFEVAENEPEQLEEERRVELVQGSLHPPSPATASSGERAPSSGALQLVTEPTQVMSAAAAESEQRAPAEKSLSISRSGSGGVPSHSHTAARSTPEPRTRRASDSSVEPPPSAGSCGGQALSASVSSSARVDPCNRGGQRNKTAHRHRRLKLPLISPQKDSLAAKQESVTPRSPHREPPQSLDPLNTDLLQRLQEKVDLETSKLRLIDLQSVPSGPPDKAEHRVSSPPPPAASNGDHTPRERNQEQLPEVATSAPRVENDQPEALVDRMKPPQAGTSIVGKPTSTATLATSRMLGRAPAAACASPTKNSGSSPQVSTPPKAKSLKLHRAPKVPRTPDGHKNTGKERVVPAAAKDPGITTAALPGMEPSSLLFSVLQTPEKTSNSRTTSPKLDVIIDSLRSRRISSETAETGDGGSSCSPEEGSGEPKRRKRRKLMLSERVVKKLRMEEREDCKMETSSAQPSPTLEPATDGGRGLERESETENMSVSSSQHSSSREGDPALMTPHRKFASDIAALDKRDKELQEKLVEAQGQVEAISRHVQEVEGLLAELTQHQRKLTSERTELTEQYKKLLIEKQNLFTSPDKDSDGQGLAENAMTSPNFFEKMKELSEKEQDMQMKLLQGNQLLEEVSIKRSKEERRLGKMRAEKLQVAHTQFATLKAEYKEVQKQKQDVLMSSWNIPLPPSPMSGEKLGQDVLPLQSCAAGVPETTPPDSSKPVDSSSSLSLDPMEAETSAVTREEPMEGMATSALPLPPDHSAYTQHHPLPHSLHPDKNQLLTIPAPVSLTSPETPSRTELTPLTPRERLHPFPSDPAHQNADLHLKISPSPEDDETGANEGGIPTSPTTDVEVKSILCPGGVLDSQPFLSEPFDQQEMSDIRSDGACDSPSSETVAAMGGGGRGVACVIVKLESVLSDDEDANYAFTSGGVGGGVGDGGRVMGEQLGDGGGGDSIRQAWMAAQALISIRHTADPPSGTSPNHPLEVGEGEGEGEVREKLSAEVKENEGEGEVREKVKEGEGEIGEAISLGTGVGEEESDRAKLKEYCLHQSSVLGVKVSGEYLYSCSSDKSVRVSKILGGGGEGRKFRKHRRSITCIEVFSCGGDVYIVSGSTDKHIIMYSIKSGEVEIDFSLGARVQCMASRGNLLVTGLSNGFIHVINLQVCSLAKTKTALGKWLAGEDPVKKDVSCLCLHRNMLFTACYDHTISCWDVSDYERGVVSPTPTRIHLISSFSGLVLCMQVEGDLLYCGTADNTLEVFNTQTWEACGEVKGHNGAVSGLCVSGHLLITSCFDRLIRCFDTRDKTLLQVYSLKDLPFTLCTSRDTVYCGLRSGRLVSIKIDLNTYHQCQWGKCGLKFGIEEHLRHHMKEHGSTDGEEPLLQDKPTSSQATPTLSQATPTSLLPTTSVVGSAHSSAVSEENEASYLRTLREMQSYLPVLSGMMTSLVEKEGREAVKTENYLRLKSLYCLLQDDKKRISLPILIKCKKALEVYEQQKQKLRLQQQESSSSSSLRPTTSDLASQQPTNSAPSSAPSCPSQT